MSWFGSLFKGAGSFLGGLFGNAASGAASTVGSSLTSEALGANKVPQLSWGDFNRMQDQATAANPQEIARQGAFLEGVAPSQANAYNTYQDSTHGADTQRQIDRVKSTGEQLGMSPWELTGHGGANPLPAPAFGQPNAGASNQFLQSMIPLLSTKMSNDTQMRIAAMNNDTSLKQTSMQTAKGQQALAGVEQTKAQTALTAAQELTEIARQATEMARPELLWSQTAETKVRTYLSALPSETIRSEGYEHTAKTGWDKLLNAVNNEVQFGQAWRSIPNESKKSIIDRIIRNSQSMIESKSNVRERSYNYLEQGANIAMDWGDGVLKKGQQYLKNYGKQ